MLMRMLFLAEDLGCGILTQYWAEGFIPSLFYFSHPIDNTLYLSVVELGN